MKTLSQRLSESIEIRKGIKQMGVEVLDTVRSELSEMCNAFVKDGVSSSRRVRIDRQAALLVTLQAEDGKQSGMTLERLTN